MKPHNSSTEDTSAFQTASQAASSEPPVAASSKGANIQSKNPPQPLLPVPTVVSNDAPSAPPFHSQTNHNESDLLQPPGPGSPQSSSSPPHSSTDQANESSMTIDEFLPNNVEDQHDQIDQDHLNCQLLTTQ